MKRSNASMDKRTNNRTNHRMNILPQAVAAFVELITFYRAAFLVDALQQRALLVERRSHSWMRSRSRTHRPESASSATA
jgi:hypothetical protein